MQIISLLYSCGAMKHRTLKSYVAYNESKVVHDWARRLGYCALKTMCQGIKGIHTYISIITESKVAAKDGFTATTSLCFLFGAGWRAAELIYPVEWLSLGQEYQKCWSVACRKWIILSLDVYNSLVIFKYLIYTFRVLEVLHFADVFILPLLVSWTHVFVPLYLPR